MRLLLDTSALLWWLGTSKKLGEHARAAIVAPENTIFVSAASAWEVAVKRVEGRLDAEGEIEGWLEENDFIELPISIAHAAESAMLPFHHRDPFDRLLIAQSRLERMALVTSDAKIAKYEVEILAAHQ